MISTIDTRGPAVHIGQIRDPQAFITKLREKNTPPFTFLINQFDELTRSQITSGNLTPAELAAGLSKIIASESSLYEANRFRSFNLRPETKKLVQLPTTLSKPDLQRLNRLLLEDSLSQYLSKYVPRTEGGISMLHISDLHLRSGMDLARNSKQYALSHFEDKLRKVCKAEGDGEKYVDLILVTGDLVDYLNPVSADHEKSLLKAKEFLEYLAGRYCALGRQGLVVIPGNHDYRWFGNVPVASGQDRFAEIFKEYLGHKLFRFESVDLVVACFDSNNGEKLDWARGEVDIKDLNALEQQLSQLSKDLDAAEDPLQQAYKVALVHHHPFPVPSADRTKPSGLEKLAGKPVVGGAEYMLMRNAGVFVNKLLQHDFRLVLHGHLHEKGYWRVVAHDEEDSEKWLEVLAGASLLSGKHLSFNLALLEANGFLEITNYGWNDEGNPAKSVTLPSTPYEVIRTVPSPKLANIEAASKLYSQFWTVHLDKGDFESVEIIKGYHALSKPVSEIKLLTTAPGLASSEFEAREIAQGNQTVAALSTEPDSKMPNTLNYFLKFQPHLQQNSNRDFVCKYFYKGVMFRSRDDQMGVQALSEPGWDRISQKIIRPTGQMIIKLRFVPDKVAQTPWVPEKIDFEVHDEWEHPCPRERDSGHIVFEHISPRFAKDCWLPDLAHSAILTIHKPRLHYRYILKWQLQPEVQISREIDVRRWQDDLLAMDADRPLAAKGTDYLEKCLQALVAHHPKLKKDAARVAVFLFAYDRKKHELVPRCSLQPDKASALDQKLQYGHDVVGTAFRRREVQQYQKQDQRFEFLRKLMGSDLHYVLACPVNFPDGTGWPVAVVAFASVDDTGRLHECCKDLSLMTKLPNEFSNLFIQTFDT